MAPDMRNVFWQMMVSLDGLHEGPDHDLSWHVTDDDFARYVDDMLGSIGAILLGRKTYELFAEYWPSSTDPEARAMNELPKIVFSRTLRSLDWQNSILVEGDVAEQVTRLKQGPGKDLALFGSAELASTFMRHGLIDEYRIFVNPVVLGSGTPMFKDVEERTKLELVQTQTLGSGVVILSYRPGDR